MAKVSYDESSISRQLGLEGVREFPTMYLGERGDSMAFQGAKEIIDNANDEFLAGRNKSVFMYADNKRNQYMVADEAEGVPVGLRAIDPSNPKSKKVSTLTMIFTELHTGGKVNNKAYKFSKGVHGVGAACTNAVSSSFEVWTRREGIWYYQKFEKGVPSFDLKSRSVPDARVVKILGKKPTRGTIILWSFDQSVISIDKGKTKAVVNMQFMANWVKTYADLNPGIVMTVATPKHRKTFCNKEGIKSLLKKRVEDAGLTPLGRPLVYESEDMTLSIQWTNRPDDTGLETYVCSGRTIFDGEHEVGFRKALFAALKPMMKLPKSVKLAPKDLYMGLVGMFDYRMNHAEYSNQTKERLVSNVAKQVEDQLKPVLSEYFSKNKSLVGKIVRYARASKKARDELSKSLKSASDAKALTRRTLPDCLYAAPKATPKNRELYLVEGDSAAGTAKNARNKDYQEVVKLDGVIMNAYRNSIASVLSSEKLVRLLSCIGYNFDSLKEGANRDQYSSLRIDKLILLPDADEDGHHIRVLVLALIQKLMPRLFDEGRVYVVDAPLYSAYYNGKRYFGDSHKEVLTQLPKSCKAIISRAKGWGEISATMLEHIAFNPETRNILKVAPAKGKNLSYFESLVGSETSTRKELLGV